MIQLRTKPTDKLIELGGGSCPLVRPNCDVRWCYDAEGKPTVDFTADFNELLPIQSSEFDGVFCRYTLEHISYRKVRQFIAEVFRILKEGGKCVFVTPNTAAQLKWAEANPEGWDGKDFFDSMSGMLFGDQDYPENSHKLYLDMAIAQQLLKDAGFTDVKTTEYGERKTDMIIEGVKPVAATVTNLSTLARESNKVTTAQVLIPPQQVASAITGVPREELFGKDYFNGGKRYGGYAREGYWDYPVHEVTATHILKRKPESVLEVGSARGYILKRIQDAGIFGQGLEISKHCVMTRVCEEIIQWDLCKTPWPFRDRQFDLCYSVAVMEHVPEEFIPAVLAEMSRVSRRGLHGIDFGGKDDGFDKTHFTLHDKDWWENQFRNHAYETVFTDNGRDGFNVPYTVEILNKEELEVGDYPADLFTGDGKTKLNIGSFTTCFHRGWLNIDIHPLQQFAQAYRYNYLQHDVRNGLSMFGTESVDLIFASHFLEHLNYKEGLSFLKECRRVIKPDGCIRIVVPDAARLIASYSGKEYNEACGVMGVVDISEYDEINDGCANAPTDASKLYALLHEGHAAIYDAETLCVMLNSAGFDYKLVQHRTGNRQMQVECLSTFPCLSLYVEGTCRTA